MSFQVGDYILTTYTDKTRYINKIVEMDLPYFLNIIQIQSIDNIDSNVNNGKQFSISVCNDNKLLTDELKLELL